MKKKFLALVCAAVMVMGMSITALATPSSSSGAVAGSGNTGSGTTSGSGSSSATSQGVTNNSGSSSNSSNSSSNITINVGSKQIITSETLSYFATSTTVEGGTVAAVNETIAREAVSQATQVYGEDTFIAAIVDINVPGATFPYNLTIKCKDVWAGQTVTILHKVGDQWERLSPRTGDISLMVSGLTGLFAAGIVFTGRKKRR